MRHHYVPEFLQRPWADRSTDGRLEVFRLDLPILSSKRHRPKHIGFEHDLFALTRPTVAGLEQQTIEKHVLRKVDQSASLIRDRLLDGALNNLTDEEKSDWIRFLSSLRLRQPQKVASLRALAESNLRASLSSEPREYQSINSNLNLPTLEAWTDHHHPGLIENFGLSLFQKLIDDPNLGNKIARMKWWVWYFDRSPHELMLGDNPCVVAGDLNGPDCLIALPISPRRAFIATSGKVSERLKRQNAGVLAALINETSFAQARARIYAVDRKPQKFIANRLRHRIGRHHA